MVSQRDCRIEGVPIRGDCLNVLKHDLSQGLWFAIEHARSIDTECYKQREQARFDALSKLTDDDKKALGLRV